MAWRRWRLVITLRANVVNVRTHTKEVKQHHPRLQVDGRVKAVEVDRNKAAGLGELNSNLYMCGLETMALTEKQQETV